jgi:hypothetical protein
LFAAGANDFQIFEQQVIHDWAYLVDGRTGVP